MSKTNNLSFVTEEPKNNFLDPPEVDIRLNNLHSAVLIGSEFVLSLNFFINYFSTFLVILTTKENVWTQGEMTILSPSITCLLF